jgi:hypothetical protein
MTQQPPVGPVDLYSLERAGLEALLADVSRCRIDLIELSSDVDHVHHVS